jgi:hypothetical protein
MDITRIGSQPSGKGPANWFTGPPPHQFRGFSLDMIVRGLSNTCPREVTDGEVMLIWEIPVQR